MLVNALCHTVDLLRPSLHSRTFLCWFIGYRYHTYHRYCRSCLSLVLRWKVSFYHFNTTEGGEILTVVGKEIEIF